MKVYHFKCKCCGSSSYTKTDDDTYVCKYCGYEEKVLDDAPKKEPEEPEPKTESPNSEHASIINMNQIDEIKRGIKKISLTKKYMFFLTLFFGCVGVHKYIKGEFILFLIYFFTFGLFGVGWGIDVIFSFIDLVMEFKKNQDGDKDD